VCGDGIREPGEECDDGNASNTDACPSTCAAARCGDGLVWEGHEACAGDAFVDCPTACGGTGRRGCSSCHGSAVCEPPGETCNGADDACDTATDEIFACLRGTMRSCA
jgi:cysteine-rich repeat protein